MSIQYREDPDLEFLQYCENDDLKALADILIYRKSGKERINEELSVQDRFRQCKGKYREVWDLLGAELQLYGGDSIVNLLRGVKTGNFGGGWGIVFQGRRGCLYREILIDVCKKLRVAFDVEEEVQEIERHLLMKIIRKAINKMTLEEKKLFAVEMKLNTEDYSTRSIVIALQAAVKIGGFRSYEIAAIVANAAWKVFFGKGLTPLSNAALMRWISVLSGPVGWAISGISMLPLATSPAYRVIFPAVVHVAYLREKNQVGKA
jgi:uncharacterized protein YaaW (UPF0174 family)